MYTHHKLDHDFEEGAETAVRYLVCAVPRSGSSLLSELLFNTGQAGAPAEYLDPALMKRFRARWCARKAARKSWSNTSASSPHERMRYAVIDQDPGCRCAHPGYAGSTIL